MLNDLRFKGEAFDECVFGEHVRLLGDERWRSKSGGKGIIIGITLKNALVNHFTAKPLRTQRTYRKNKSHPFGEVVDHLDFDSNH
jgi:hypothetical protein